MSDTDAPEVAVNDQLVLIMGESGTGKSASLRNIPNQERWLYLNCEAGKRLPFRNKFQTHTITDPFMIFDAFDFAQNNPDIDGIIIDTVTFMMNMFESQYIIGAADTMKGWSQYQEFFKELMQDKVANSDKSVIMLAHTAKVLNENTGEWEVAVPVKGALAKNGIEAFFSTAVATKLVSLKDIKDADRDLCPITEDDELVGYKHVFQTRRTKQTKGERMRGPMHPPLFTANQTYIDNDADMLLRRLHDYYAD